MREQRCLFACFVINAMRRDAVRIETGFHPVDKRQIAVAADGGKADQLVISDSGSRCVAAMIQYPLSV